MYSYEVGALEGQACLAPGAAVVCHMCCTSMRGLHHAPRDQGVNADHAHQEVYNKHGRHMTGNAGTRRMSLLGRCLQSCLHLLLPVFRWVFRCSAAACTSQALLGPFPLPHSQQNGRVVYGPLPGLTAWFKTGSNARLKPGARPQRCAHSAQVAKKANCVMCTARTPG